MSEFDKMERWANGVRSSGRDLVARPNFTIPNGPPAVEPPLRLGGPTPGTAVANAPYRPNFTMGAADVVGESRGGRFAGTNGAAADAAVKPSIRDPGPGNPYAGKPAFVPPPPVQGGQAAAAGTQTGAAAAKPVSGVRNFFTGGAPGGVGGAFKNVGGSAVNAAGTVARGAAKLAGPAAALGAIYDGFTTDTQDYEQRLGLQGNRTLEGTDAYGRDLRLGADLTTRALGIAGGVAGASGATTEAYRKRYGNETTDPSLAGDLMNRTLGVGEDVLRTWSGNDLINNLTGGAIGFDPRNDAQPLVAPKPVPATQPGVTAPRYAFPNTAGGGRGAVRPAPANPNDPPPTNGLASNLAPDLGDGIRKLQQGGRTLYTNVAGDNASMFKPGTISAQNSAAADALSARYGAEARATAQAQIDGAKPQSLRARLAQQLEGKELTAKGVAALARAEELDNAREDRATTNAITLRGQDITDRGHLMTARTAAAAARADQANKDRAYNLDVEKHGVEKAKILQAQRQQSDKDLTTKLESMFTTKDWKGNQTVDKARVAEHKQAITAYIGTMIDDLVSKGTPQSVALAEKLREAGPSALGDDRLQQLIVQLEAKARNNDGAGWSPFSGKRVDSADPSKYDVVGVDRGVFQDQYVHANGARTPTRALNYRDGGNAWLPNSWGDASTDRFDILKPKGVRNGQ